MEATNREALVDWLSLLAQRYTLVAPQMVETELLYRPVHSGDEVVFDFERTVLSPKTFFLPDTQAILRVEKKGRDVVLGAPVMEREQVVFAVRPCDARGLRALDSLLLEHGTPDGYFGDYRAGTTLVGLACARLWEDCFCTSLGGAPDDATHVDLMLHEAEGEYLVQVLTDRGASILEGLAVHATDRPLPKVEADDDARALPPTEDWPSLFDDLYWQRLADRCLSCHACTYVCPTCRCFDVRDETLASGAGYTHIERLRAWDSCLSAGYRRIAGGHNPRPTRAQRLRNRIYCKFHYSPLEFGAVACVGCGRCIAVCPVGIDMAEVLVDVCALVESYSSGDEIPDEPNREGEEQ
jgi:ferredoxin